MANLAGYDETIKTLTEFPQEVQKGGLRQAITAGTKVFRGHIERKAPNNTGLMRKAADYKVKKERCLRVLAAGIRKPRAPRQAKPAGEGGKSKREICAELLTRPEGATAAELMEATGWPSISVPAAAKANGLELRTVKEGRATRYFGRAAA